MVADAEPHAPDFFLGILKDLDLSHGSASSTKLRG